MKPVVTDDFGTQWEIQNWHELPVPKGIIPDAFLTKDGSMVGYEECRGSVPVGATHWLVMSEKTGQPDPSDFKYAEIP